LPQVPPLSDSESSENEDDGTRNEDDGAKNEDDGAKNEDDGAKNEDDGAKNEDDGVKNEDDDDDEIAEIQIVQQSVLPTRTQVHVSAHMRLLYKG
jgi:hypothetical protein